MEVQPNSRIISVTGLGYIGLPVAAAFSKRYPTIGYDQNTERVAELHRGNDSTHELSSSELKACSVEFTSDPAQLKRANFHIACVPTPIAEGNQPDLSAIREASKTIGKAVKPGDVVVFESTVYPGVTEEVALPIILEHSGLKPDQILLGYSPERINPGDKERSFTKILKIVSGCNSEALEIIAATYESVVTAGVHRAPSIRVAEAAKLIENVQRDLNISLMNELSLIFEKLDIDTQAVLEAAGTKWNFLHFTPGLVGGHCIAVDPYYLTYRAEQVGYQPEVILSGRRVNAAMGKFIADKLVRQMILQNHRVKGSTATILGLTFKENCADIRNSRVPDILAALKEYGIKVQVHDPLANATEARKYYGVELIEDVKKLKPAEALIGAVAHQTYRNWNRAQFRSLLKPEPVIIDVKNFMRPIFADHPEVSYWCL